MGLSCRGGTNVTQGLLITSCDEFNRRSGRRAERLFFACRWRIPLLWSQPGISPLSKHPVHGARARSTVKIAVNNRPNLEVTIPDSSDTSILKNEPGRCDEYHRLQSMTYWEPTTSFKPSPTASLTAAPQDSLQLESPS